jgi:hypothetical protein
MKSIKPPPHEHTSCVTEKALLSKQTLSYAVFSVNAGENSLATIKINSIISQVRICSLTE